MPTEINMLKKIKNFLNELYNVGINYLNIFSKSDIKAYSIIILNKRRHFTVSF